MEDRSESGLLPLCAYSSKTTILTPCKFYSIFVMKKRRLLPGKVEGKARRSRSGDGDGGRSRGGAAAASELYPVLGFFIFPMSVTND